MYKLPKDLVKLKIKVLKKQMDEYVKKTSKKIRDSFYEKNLWNTKVYIKDKLPKDFNINKPLTKVQNSIHKNYFNLIDYIMIGDFDFLNKRDLDAAYDNGVIYLRNDHEKELNMADDIVHEVAHAVEKKNQDKIYGDGRLEREFLVKRRNLYYLLGDKEYGIEAYENPEYDYDFDQHLYKDIGYNHLRGAAAELFYSPYAITALREYWANGFENYLLGVRGKLKEISPVLFQKVDSFFEF